MARPVSPSRRRSLSGPTTQSQLVQLGERLAAHRAALGMERAQLASRLGVTTSRLRKIEEGTGRLEASLLYAWVKELGIGFSQLFGDIETPPPLDPEARELMRLFAAIPDPGIRKSILKLTKALSEKP
ncbi:MAG: helix-turn-helix domain-containing protein [Rhodospirillales bacterium]|nr:helix-turn-helix domain-containing protein [Rhodospirillales bacterium]